MTERIEQVQRAFTAYTIERELGAGGMATVYLAHDKSTIARSRSRFCMPSSRRSWALNGSSKRSESRPICSTPTSWG